MASRDRPESLQERLDRHEVEVTRAVTAAVTTELSTRHEAELARCRSRVAALEAELAALHEELHDVRGELTRIRLHPVVRLGRAARRVLSRTAVPPREHSDDTSGR